MILKADKTLKGPNVKIVSWMIEIEGSSVCLSTTALKSCHPHLISELPTSCQLNIVKKTMVDMMKIFCTQELKVNRSPKFIFQIFTFQEIKRWYKIACNCINV